MEDGGQGRMGYDALVIGSWFCDLVFSALEDWPEPGKEVYAEQFAMGGGGAYITAVALSRLGLRTGFVTTLGTDILSRWIAEQLEAERVDLTPALRVPGPYYNITAAINWRDRAFLTYAPKGPDLVQQALATVKADPPQFLVTGAGPQSTPLMTEARVRGTDVVMQLAWREDWLKSEAIWEVVREGSRLILNEPEALTMTGASSVRAALERLRGTCPHVIVTRGANGVMFHEPGRGMVETPPRRVEQVADTTGAGDNFTAGVVAGLLRYGDTAQAVRIGTYCGSRSVEGLGGTACSPTWAEVVTALDLREGEKIGRDDTCN